MRLNEELDLPDAAAPQLHIVACDGNPLATFVAVDLAFDRVNVLNGIEIEVLAPDERAQLLKEGLAELQIAGYRARLYHGGTLPVLTDALVVGHGADIGNRQGHGAGVGPKAQVGAIGETVGGRLFEHLHERAC